MQSSDTATDRGIEQKRVQQEHAGEPDTVGPVRQHDRVPQIAAGCTGTAETPVDGRDESEEVRGPELAAQ